MAAENLQVQAECRVPRVRLRRAPEEITVATFDPSRHLTDLIGQIHVESHGIRAPGGSAPSSPLVGPWWSAITRSSCSCVVLACKASSVR